MKLFKRADRIAFAVGDLDKARRFFEGVLGAEFGDVTEVEDFKFRYQPFTLAGAEMELLTPTDPESVIARFLMKYRQGFHHVSFEVDDLDEAAKALGENNVEVVSRHDYSKPYEGHRVREAFIHPRDAFGILIHLVEKRPAAGR